VNELGATDVKNWTNRAVSGDRIADCAVGRGATSRQFAARAVVARLPIRRDLPLSTFPARVIDAKEAEPRWRCVVID
jgi:hypothetical protein